MMQGKFSVPDGKWEKIVDLEGNTHLAGSFLSLSPEGQPVIMSHTRVAQIYYLHWKQ
jgi:hypothetical protein